MNLFMNIDHYDQLNRSGMKTVDQLLRHRGSWFNRECLICGSKAIGMNFGAPTCAPCKAFFRRNARRKEILESACQHAEKDLSKAGQFEVDEKSILYLRIRRCTYCRLRRCFEMGMKEELIRSEEENKRHKQMVDINRKRRELFEQEQLAISQSLAINRDLLTKTDWSDLSNIVSAYEIYGIRTYIAERGKMLLHETFPKQRTIEDYAVLPMSIVLSLSIFVRSLATFQSLPRTVQNVLCEGNLRQLTSMHLHELNQSCFSEPSQIAAYRAGWEFICGPELFRQFIHIDDLAKKLIIADPIVTRLWLVVLFFSTPLFCIYDPRSYVTKMRKKIPCLNIQNEYVTLLWKYLLFRHGYMESARIYSDLVRIYLYMLRIALEINMRFRMRIDFRETHKTLEKITTLNRKPKEGEIVV